MTLQELSIRAAPAGAFLISTTVFTNSYATIEGSSYTDTVLALVFFIAALLSTVLFFTKMIFDVPALRGLRLD